MTGEAQAQHKPLSVFVSLIFLLSCSCYLSVPLLLCSCAGDKPADRRQFLSATLINAAWHVPVRAVAVHTHTHTLSHPCTHWDTHIGSLLTWNICGVLWSRFAFNYAPGHGRVWPSLVPNGDRDWASCQSPLTLTCMLLGLFNSDCETVPSITIHPPGSASFDWIGIISKIYVTESPGRTSSHVAHFWLMMCPALINAHSLPFLPPHVTPHAPSLRHALPCVMSCHVYGVI